MPNDIAAGVGGGGTIKLIGVANNSELYQDSLAPTAGAAWTGWSRITPVSATVTGTPATVQDSNGVWHVFVRDYDNGALLEDTQPPGTTTWNADTSLGGTWIYNPAAQADARDLTYVWIVGTGGDLYSDGNGTGTGNGWAGWADDGAGYVGAPGSSTYWNASSSYSWRNSLVLTKSGTIEAINGLRAVVADIEVAYHLIWNSLDGSFAGS